MPTVKEKSGAACNRYRPASEYDDATLAQKREYWRTKKREQRARRTEQRGASAQRRREEQLLNRNTHEVLNSGSFATPSFPVRNSEDSHSLLNSPVASQSSLTAIKNRKEKWNHPTRTLNTVLPKLSVSCSPPAKAAGNAATVKCRLTQQATKRAITLATPTEAQVNNISLVPPLTVNPIANVGCAQARPQPHLPTQDTTVLSKEQDALHTQMNSLPAKVSTGVTPVSSPCDAVSVKTEGKMANATPQGGTQCALVTIPRANSNGIAHPFGETEEERAAKRREHWRIKKREQRAKLAARIGVVRERRQNTEMPMLRHKPQKTGLMGAASLQLLPNWSMLKAAGQRQCPARAKAAFSSGKKEKTQNEAARLTDANLQIKNWNPHVVGTTQRAITFDGISMKIPGESSRKLPSYAHISNVTRGMTRCKTARQRFIDAQKNFMNVKNLRCKSQLLASVFGTRNIPRIDPSDTPEQIIAKQREYWRIKKREQRAKLSGEVKARLKEKDSLMRRMKRYQSILQEMRRARGLAQSAGSTLMHASETIGGFIKEDGTLTKIQIPKASIGHTPAVFQSDQELNVGSNNTSVTQPQQPYTKQRVVNETPTPCCPPQVKMSLPSLSVSRPSKLLPVRTRTPLASTTSNSQSLPLQPVGQLTLTHPRTTQNATTGSNPPGCVMKMVVSSGAVTSLSAITLDPELTEEERMAKKREYWRIKKREQRAARAVRLKQGSLQARVNAALQRRKAQKQAAASSVHLSKHLIKPLATTQPLSMSSVSVSPNANEIKQEREPMSKAEGNSHSEQAICPDIISYTSSPPSPAPPAEPDPALSADSQATTLRAVASMKKLLEETLSTVGECQGVQTNVKTEAMEETEEQEMKPILPQQLIEKNNVVPLSADLMLQIKSWQPDSIDLIKADSPIPHLKDLPSCSKTLPLISAPSEEVPPSTCEHSSQTPSNVIIIPYLDMSDSQSSPHRTLRLCPKQVSCSPEPPNVHHLPTDQLHPQEEHIEKEAKSLGENGTSHSSGRGSSVAVEQRGLSSLQRKREYWKLMKRQQRARLKARQRERHGEYSRRMYPASIQVPAFSVSSAVKVVNPKAALQHKPSLPSRTAESCAPAVPVLGTTSLAKESVNALGSVSCLPRNEQNSTNCGPLGSRETPQNQQQSTFYSQEWTSTSADEDPSLSSLKPPDNPLSTHKMQPVQTQGGTPASTFLSPIKIPCSQQSRPTCVIQPPSHSMPAISMVPPKRLPGEPDEDFLRRKREYWRVKKKEQRARKAIQVERVTPRKTSTNWRPALLAQAVPTQDPGEWPSSREELDHFMSSSVNTGSFPSSSYATPMEDESDMLFADYENNSNDDASMPDAMWRNRYLMDYDPLNQLLVCMVCGELQYSRSLEGVKAHISDAHPETSSLDAGERRRIMEAWDEQVSQRERFFTSQLQQHSGCTTGAHES